MPPIVPCAEALEARTLFSIPAAPSDAVSVAMSGTEVVIGWVDNSNDEDGFQIQRATDAGFTTGVTMLSAAADEIGYTDSGLTGQTDYYYRVRAWNTSGNSSYTSATAVLTNASPVISTAAAGSPSTITAHTSTLSVAATDDGGSGNLTYIWSSVGAPPAKVYFSSANGTSSGNSVTATFYKAGSYDFQVVVRDDGAQVAVDTVNVTVSQTLTSISVEAPGATVWLATGNVASVSATAFDQFGDPMDTQPTFSWSVTSGPGSVDSGGLFTAGMTHGRSVVTASAGGESGESLIAVGDYAGTIYGDADGSGWQSVNELGLEGWFVYWDYDNDLAHDVGEPGDTTDEFGNYAFDVPPPQTGGLVVGVPSGWTNTAGYGYVQDVSILNELTVDDNDSSETADSGEELVITADPSTELGSIHISADAGPTSPAYDHVLYQIVDHDGNVIAGDYLPSTGVDEDLPLGDFVVRSGVDTNGDAFLSPREVTRQLEVKNIVAKLVITTPATKSATIKKGERVTFTVTVTKADGSAYAGLKVSANILDGTAPGRGAQMFVSTGTTDANGRVSFVVVGGEPDANDELNIFLDDDTRIQDYGTLAVTN